MATFPPLLWEKTSEWCDGCFIQALVQTLGKFRCSYFADTNLPLAIEIIHKSGPTPQVAGSAAHVYVCLGQ